MVHIIGNKHKKLPYTEYHRIFLDALNSGKKISSQYSKYEKIQTLQYDPDEEWKQCYDPDDKMRSQLPIQWFVSNKGNLVTVSSTGKCLTLIRKQKDAQGYTHYCFYMKKNDGTIVRKSIMEHTLVAIVFGSEKIGRAEKLIEEKGVYATGIRSDSVQTHHIDKDNSHNNPENLQMMIKELHNLVDKYPAVDADDKTKEKYCRNVIKVMKKEFPDEMAMIVTGHTFDRKTQEYREDIGHCYVTQNIKFTEESMRQINEMALVAQCKQLVDMISEQLLTDKGIEYFNTPKYLTIGEEYFYKCVRDGEDKFLMEEVDKEEAKDKKLIHCFVGDDGYAYGYIEEEISDEELEEN